MPEPDLVNFLAGLYTQALMMLGVLENPVTKKREANLREAQYLIDIIAMLSEKMKGNLTDDEERYLKGILYNLRMRFVETRSAGEKKQP